MQGVYKRIYLDVHKEITCLVTPFHVGNAVCLPRHNCSDDAIAVGWRLSDDASFVVLLTPRLSIDAIACWVILGVTYMHSACCVLFIYWLHHVELVFLNISEDVLCLIGLIYSLSPQVSRLVRINMWSVTSSETSTCLRSPCGVQWSLMSPRRVGFLGYQWCCNQSCSTVTQHNQAVLC